MDGRATRSPGRRVLLAVAMLPWLAAGCSSGADQAASVPPLTPSAVATSTPTLSEAGDATAGATPGVADQQAAVLAAVRNYFAQATKAVQTGDTTGLKAAATASCPCQELVLEVASAWAAGSVRGGGWTVSDLRYQGGSSARAFATAEVRSAAYVTLGPDGQVTQRIGAVDSRRLFTLQRSGGRWLVGMVQVIQGGS